MPAFFTSAGETRRVILDFYDALRRDQLGFSRLPEISGGLLGWAFGFFTADADGATPRRKHLFGVLAALVGAPIMKLLDWGLSPSQQLSETIKRFCIENKIHDSIVRKRLAAEETALMRSAPTLQKAYSTLDRVKGSEVVNLEQWVSTSEARVRQYLVEGTPLSSGDLNWDELMQKVVAEDLSVQQNLACR